MLLNRLIVIQPVSLCNLNCAYCYVPDRKNSKIMSSATLENIAKVIFNSSVTTPSLPGESLLISWHSGEPLTVGMEFYQTAIDLFEKYNKNKVSVNMSIQTNGLLLNQKWCDFFNKHKFSVGVSIDGPEFVHDRYRKDWNGRGSFKRAMRGINLLQENNIPFANIAVLTDHSLDYPDEIYQFYKNNGFIEVGFNVDEQEGNHATSSYYKKGTKDIDLDSVRRYKQFMSRFFDLWIQDKRPFGVREFDNIIARTALYQNLDYRNATFASESIAFAHIGISRDGDICTFSPELTSGTANNPKEFVIGNVNEIDSFDELEKNNNYKRQLKAINQGVLNCSNSCEYFDMCGGGSPSNKWAEKDTFEATETLHCRLTRMELIDLVLLKLSNFNAIVNKDFQPIK